MIQLECSNCKTLLSIDDAFAGGVCRCQHCGTIQTVPKPGKDAAVAANANSPKALFKRKARIESALNPYSDSLDKAADELGSSGALSASAVANVGAPRRSASDASSSSQTGVPSPAQSTSPLPRSGKPGASVPSSPPPSAPKAKPAPPPVQTPSYMPTPSKSAGPALPPKPAVSPALIFGCAIGMAVVIGAVAWFAFSHRNSRTASPGDRVAPSASSNAKPPTVSPASQGAAVTTVDAPNTPATQAQVSAGAICGIPLTDASVVYLIDRAGCTQQTFQQLVDTCYKSVESLGTGKRFQVVILNNYQDLAYPAAALADSSAAEVDAARKTIVDTSAGSSDVGAVISRITSLSPAAIVCLSAMDLDPTAANQFRAGLKDKNIKVHGVAIGAELAGQQLRTLAGEFGGQFKQADLASSQ